MAKKLFKPNSVVKSTIYIGSGAAGTDLVTAINAEMKRTGLDFSPMMIQAFILYHKMNKAIEVAAKQQNLETAMFINLLFASHLNKNLTPTKGR